MEINLEDHVRHVEGLHKIVAEYNELVKTNCQDVGEYMTLRDRATNGAFFLSEFLGNMKIEYNQARFIRKMEVVKTKASLIRDGKSAAAAQTAAEEEKELEYQNELEKEGIAVRCELILKSTYELIYSIRQRISVMMKEYNQTES